MVSGRVVMAIEHRKYWTPERKELRAWFQRNAPSLGELYEGALEMVFRDFPGRVRFVAHAVREIRNRLPDSVAGPREGGSVDYKSRLDAVAQVWEESGLPIDGSSPIQVTETESLPSNQDIALPQRVYEEVARLLADHNRTRETKTAAAARLFEAIDPNNRQAEAVLRPRIKNWIDITEWFVERAHDRAQRDAEMGSEELRRRFEAFESALFAITRGFFETVEELDEILEQANS